MTHQASWQQRFPMPHSPRPWMAEDAPRDGVLLLFLKVQGSRIANLRRLIQFSAANGERIRRWGEEAKGNGSGWRSLGLYGVYTHVCMSLYVGYMCGYVKLCAD